MNIYLKKNSERTDELQILLKFKENITLTHQKDFEIPLAKSTWGNSGLPSCSVEPCVGLCEERLWWHLLAQKSQVPLVTPSWQLAERIPHSGASDCGR